MKLNDYIEDEYVIIYTERENIKNDTTQRY